MRRAINQFRPPRFPTFCPRSVTAPSTCLNKSRRSGQWTDNIKSSRGSEQTMMSPPLHPELTAAAQPFKGLRDEWLHSCHSRKKQLCFKWGHKKKCMRQGCSQQAGQVMAAWITIQTCMNEKLQQRGVQLPTSDQYVSGGIILQAEGLLWAVCSPKKKTQFLSVTRRVKRALNVLHPLQESAVVIYGILFFSRRGTKSS